MMHFPAGVLQVSEVSAGFECSPGEGTPLCDLNGDVRPDRGIYFTTFCLKQGIAT